MPSQDDYLYKLLTEGEPPPAEALGESAGPLPTEPPRARGFDFEKEMALRRAEYEAEYNDIEERHPHRMPGLGTAMEQWGRRG